MKKRNKMIPIMMSVMLGLSMTACGTGSTSSAETVTETALETADTAETGTEAETETTVETESETEVSRESYENSEDGAHAIEADGETASYAHIDVTKTGDSEGDEADFYGENACIFATNGATLDLTDITVSTDGTHANGVFSYGEGTTVNISDSVIETTGNCSGGLMTTGGGTMNADNLTIHTTGNSSAAIRSDRGGGTVNVSGGSYTTDGTGSPVIYSTADITVSDAEMTSTASQGVVVEGQNSVTLNDVTLTADNNTKNSDKSDYYQAVMIYQSMSGDADEGLASFTMNGGSLTNKNGDVFFVNNTVCDISLSGAEIINEGDGVFLRAAAAGWGTEGSNGGQVSLTASAQTIDGDMLIDEVSNLNLYLKDGSVFTGSINPDGNAGEVYVEIDSGSTWSLTSDAYITSLTCDADAIELNGHTLYVNGQAYTEENSSTGEAIEVTVSSGGGQPEGMPGDMPGDGQGGPGGTPPEGNPPEKPDNAG